MNIDPQLYDELMSIKEERRMNADFVSALAGLKLTEALRRIPTFAGQVRADVPHYVLLGAIEQGKIDNELAALIRSYARLRVHGYHKDPAFIAIFCDGCEVDGIASQRAERGVKLIDSSAYYGAVFKAIIVNTSVSDVWNPSIAAAELAQLAADAERHGKPGIAREARAIRQTIQPSH
ncbi:hypothetical protein PTE30175_05409 [Pandoraea terrae]|uniref:Uncharacterized protein n=1 Tax=Pandoraea terrae TaxID=1537710 RepID=A0A5E4ZD42_9BURK|nr:hypothetical protein [Pandoraea terrae]VVE59301.1 hypothetical protein PTE30175_05409 [Pandoraea terrae]